MNPFEIFGPSVIILVPLLAIAFAFSIAGIILLVNYWRYVIMFLLMIPLLPFPKLYDRLEGRILFGKKEIEK